MTVLVTGAAGFVGMHVSAALLDRGETVIGIDDLNPYYDPALKQARQRSALAAGIERGAISFAGIFSPGIIEPLDKPGGDFGMQKVNAAAARRPVAMHSPGAAVEEGERVDGGHTRGTLRTADRDLYAGGIPAIL